MATRRRSRSEQLLVGADVDNLVQGIVNPDFEAAFVELHLHLTALLLLRAQLEHLQSDPGQVLVGDEVPGQEGAAAAQWELLLLLLPLRWWQRWPTPSNG